MKKAIALFSTLLILVLVVMLMSVALKNSTNIKKSILKERYLIQENLTITDVVQLVEKQIIPKLTSLSRENKISIQKILFSSPIDINDVVTNSTINVSLKSNDGRLNINLINSTDDIKNYLIRVFSKVGVKEPKILEEILLANITNSDKYRDEYKLPRKQLDKSYGLIGSYRDFQEMLLLYAQNADDENSLKIDFQKYFNFFIEVEKDNKNKTYTMTDDCKLDINYAEIELIDTLITLPAEIREQIRQKSTIYSLPFDDDTNQIAKNVLEDLSSKNILLEINITSINNKVKCMLNYNIETKKISTISMDRWIY